MCGRFVRRSSAQDFAERLAARIRDDLPPSYNVTPSQPVLVARSGADGHRELVALRWGLVPAWSQGPDNRYSMINARAETVAGKPAYRNAFKQRRCLVLTDGFYEWQKQGGRKQPFFLRLVDDSPMLMAGLWERWQGGTGEVIESCAIITTNANRTVAPVHDRMPAILAAADWSAWLSPDSHDNTALLALLKPYPDDAIVAYPVSARVNNPRTNDPACLQPATASG